MRVDMCQSMQAHCSTLGLVQKVDLSVCCVMLKENQTGKKRVPQAAVGVQVCIAYLGTHAYPTLAVGHFNETCSLTATIPFGDFIINVVGGIK